MTGQGIGRRARLPRRAMAAGAALLGLARPAAADTGLRAMLRTVLPPGLDPDGIGRLVAAQALDRPGRAVCLARAGAPAALWQAEGAARWDWVARQVAADFAAGRIVAVDGWQLAASEAWLCAALHCGA
jgi:hypothetical protein